MRRQDRLRGLNKLADFYVEVGFEVARFFSTMSFVDQVTLNQTTSDDENQKHSFVLLFFYKRSSCSSHSNVW